MDAGGRATHGAVAGRVGENKINYLYPPSSRPLRHCSGQASSSREKDLALV